MKKLIMMVAFAMMTVMSVNAQSGYEDTKHEAGISFGAMSNTTWMSIADDMGSTITLGAVKYDDSNFTGPISTEYFYHLKPTISIGAILAYAQETKSILIGNDKYGEAKNTFVTAMPAAKFNWLRKKNIGMYSKVAAGLTVALKKENFTKGDFDDLSESKIGFNFQASAFGIEVGSEIVRGFVELGVGEQGIAVAGIRVKF